MKNPTILITGAGKGIGRSIAEEFCARAQLDPSFKPRLFLVSRTPGELESLKSHCRSLGLEAEICEADLGKPAHVSLIFDSCMKAFGTLDCLINNAGVGRFGNFSELTEDDFDYVMSINLKGTFLLTQKVFAHMERKRSGHLFFITSVAAEKAFEQSAIYCMSKFGQKGLLEVLRLYAYRSNIRVTNVMPGAVYTPMWGPVEPGMQDRMMKPEDIAKLVLDTFLLPSRASVEEIAIRPVGGDL